MNTTRRSFLARILGTAVAAPLLARATNSAPSKLSELAALHKKPANVVHVKWMDPTCRIWTERVEDIDSMCRDGYHPIDIISYSCTSREQAMRHGRWVLTQQRINS